MVNIVMRSALAHTGAMVDGWLNVFKPNVHPLSSPAISTEPHSSAQGNDIRRNTTGTHADIDAKIERVSLGKLTWVNIERPTSTEIEWLRDQYPFIHPLHLEDCQSKIQRPKIDEYDDYLFIVLHFPVFDKIERHTRAGEIDIFKGWRRGAHVT